MGVRQFIALVVPGTIWLIFGLQLFFFPTTAFSSATTGYIIRDDLEYSRIAILGIQFAGAYVSLVGGYCYLLILLGTFETRQFWLFVQFLFTSIASLLITFTIFNKHDPEFQAILTPNGAWFFAHQYPIFNLFGLFFAPISFMGWLEPKQKSNTD